MKHNITQDILDWIDTDVFPQDINKSSLDTSTEEIGDINLTREGDIIKVRVTNDPTVEKSLFTMFGFATEQLKDEVNTQPGLYYLRNEDNDNKAVYKISRPTLINWII